jgi:TolB-like protein/DNA-binding winged helix-turn-helix (wHTH) protein/Tfp pilus assembly protein PilF
MESIKLNESVRFADFELNPQTYRLSRHRRALKLERIPTEILIFLIEHKGELVTREQIVERIWGRNAFLDTDNSLNGAIRKIRQALRDDAEKPCFIQTITGHGYRFIADLRCDSPLAAPTSAENSSLATSDSAADLPPPTLVQRVPFQPVLSWLTVAAISLGLVVLVLLAGWIASRSRTAQAPPSRIMLAVLPFENLTGDATQEYFSDGLTEEMITQLGNLDPKRLGVIARTSVMHYKNNQSSLDQVGRELGIQYILEGSVRRDANNVRVAAQLIETKDQTHVWARQYDREVTGLLNLQGEIAREIADEIQLTLGDHRQAVGHVNPAPHNYEAYDLYLRGQYFFNKRTAADLEEAITLFQQALNKDPNYARAYAGIAASYVILPGYNARPQGEFISRGRAAALKALQIDEASAEAHTALALLVQNFDWDWQTAEREFRRAIELNPNYATAHHWYAEHLTWRGRFDEALQESERARQLDPLSLIVAADNGAILYFSRQYDQAIERWRSVQAMDPDFLRAHLIIGAYTEKGMYREALAENERLRSKIEPPSFWSWQAYIYGREGQTAEAWRAIEKLLSLNNRRSVDPFVVGWAYLGLRDKDQAMFWLERAHAQHSIELVTLKVNPIFDFLRQDPRFANLLTSVGLTQ